MNNWITDEIDNLCNVEYGTRVVQRRDGGSVYPVYGGGDATFFMDTYNREDRLTIARFAMSAQCTRFVKGKFFLNDSGLTITPKIKSNINQQFLDFQCIALNDIFYSLAKGSAQKNLDVPAFRKLKITYPKDLKLQEKIVHKLDLIFSEIDKSVATIETNIQNTEALFQCYLREVFQGTNSGNKVYKVSDILKLEYGKGLDEADREVDGIYPAYGANGIKSRANKFLYDKPSIIVGRKGSAGELTFVNEKFWALDVTYYVTHDSSKTDLEFLYYALKMMNLPSLAKGIKPGINRNEVYNISVTLPMLSQQKKLVSDIKKMYCELEIIRNSYKSKQIELIKLKKSMLSKAFKGELVKE